jgi:diguanylate cyclase (GGDEF)-like protein
LRTGRWPKIIWLIAAYVALGLLMLVDRIIGGISVGVLAIVPLLFVGFYGSRALAIATALPSAFIFSALDHDVISPLFYAPWPVATDSVFFAIAFIAILFTVERLRITGVAASLDALTALPNRRMVFDAINAALERARRTQDPIALLFVDLDNFKAVNDRHGHAVGDHVLQYAAQRLTNAVRANDVVGRLGGDEFVVLLEDIQGRAQAQQIAEAVETALSAPFREGDVHEPLGATVGIGIYPSDGRDTVGLLNAADAQMYKRKLFKKRSHASPASGA